MAVVVVAPDSFKGTVSAADAAHAIAAGWRSVRPGDDVVEMPMADGGEGTLAAFEAAVPGSFRHPIEVYGPAPGAARVLTSWLELPPSPSRAHRVAVVELADAAGITRLPSLDPRRAHTRGLGEVIGAALDAGVDEVLVGLGGSCSTDGGAGALEALGLRVLDSAGEPVDAGGAALLEATSVDSSGLRPPPRRGVRLLTDVDNPLLGPRGAAAVFGPQKGATSADVADLEAGLRVWGGLIGADPTVAGSGAAGGTAFGLDWWGAEIVPGGRAVADLIGLPAATSRAHVVITGEGRFDEQTAAGKAPGVVLDMAAAAGSALVVIAGSVASRQIGVRTVSLTELAGSATAARSHATSWLREAGARAAEDVGSQAS